MNAYILIPIITAALFLPFATGGNPLRAWGEALGLLTIAAGAAAAIHLLATLTHSYP